ncbi:hypothetical protein [Streptomyces chromofuscus]|uniref:Uncharacterized protein n=1 Tax=Streptomyces chromofuscus TaxID=42881 RepID=A0A7M2T867_STRCW|nr:hypothetical protein [Streptomyces chromofuscus]QOV44897.1 hypothetical protein IPT68_02500 [Streptomyces chromofuscus]
MRAEASPAARRGAFIAVAVALFCVQFDISALNLAVPVLAVRLVVPERACAASGVQSMSPVILGGAPAGAAAAVTARTPRRGPRTAYDPDLRCGGAVILAGSSVLLAVRHRLVVLGRAPILGASRGERVP